MKLCHFLLKYVLIALLGLLCQPFAMASQFFAIVEGDDWRWVSAHNHGNEANHIVSSLWDIPSSHPAATEIILGAVKNAPDEVTLSANGQYYKLPIKVAGIEYRLTDVKSASDENGTANTAKTSSVATGVAEVSVIGDGLGDKKITLDKTQAAIQGLRPILNIDTAAWTQELNSKEAEEGKYSAFFTLSGVYDYIRNGTRIRYTFTLPVSISFDYSPAFISDISVSGSNEMQIIDIDEADGMISAATSYKVTATGYFSEGLLIGLLPNKSRELFSLKADIGSKAILYSVTCPDCSENQEIITKGQAKINNMNEFAFMDREPNNPRKIEFDINVTAEDIIQQNYASETYRGSFVLMFQLPI